MSICVTTQSYKNDVPTEYGLLLDMEEENGQITRVCRIDTPTRSDDGGRVKPA